MYNLSVYTTVDQSERRQACRLPHIFRLAVGFNLSTTKILRCVCELKCPLPKKFWVTVRSNLVWSMDALRYRPASVRIIGHNQSLRRLDYDVCMGRESSMRTEETLEQGV